MAGEAGGSEAGPSEKAAFRFLDLPPEVQLGIIAQCSTPDLICVALVSKRFRELAASHLYRNFHIVFPDDDDLNFDSPIDGLAGGLDTFTTSDYNYAQHLKDLSMDTLSAGFKGEQSYQSYLYSSSCGKFLNTLLHLTLRRSRCLQSFRWNIRVELSRPVYEELHRIKTLKNLHIRMQAGDSYYRTPPPLPASATSHQETHHSHWTGGDPLSPPPMPPSVGFPLGSSPPPGGVSASSLWPSNKPPARCRASKRAGDAKYPTTLAGFKDMRTLSVLDIDHTDLVDELRVCVRNSGKLKKLHLSFSDALAQQTRTSNLLNHDQDDSDVEDDYAVHDHESHVNNSAPAKLYRAAEERKVQEAVLGRILGVEPVLLKKRNMASISEPGPSSLRTDKGKENDEAPQEDAKEAFRASLAKVSKQLVAMQAGSSDLSIAQQEVLDLIAQAAKKYVEAPDAVSTPKDDAQGKHKYETDLNGESSSAGAAAAGAATVGGSGPAPAELRPTPDGTKRKLNGDGTTSDDIDIEHVETIDDPVEEEKQDAQLLHSDGDMGLPLRPTAALPTSVALPPSPVASPPVGPTRNLSMEQNENIAKLKAECADLQDEATAVARRIQDLRLDDPGQHEDFLEKAEQDLGILNRGISSLKSSIRNAERGTSSAQAYDVDASSQAMTEYVRQTRGLSLESLSIHLIPVKPSVLSRSINLHCLKQLTLLNVGNQAPIWALLKREHATQPLALRSVYTDHVSTQFILCMAALPELHELYMLQHSPKHRPETEAPPGNISLDHIRRLVLSKHIGTLKRLMIKDESNSTEWDINEKTMIMICTRGLKLEELAVSMNIHAVHAFMQYFPGLINLRALNILHFRNSDTCIWVMREILRFIVDNLSHHPELKLEWIAMENDRVDRIIRPSTGDKDDDSDSEGEGEGHGKKKRSSSGNTLDKIKVQNDSHDAYPIMPSIELDTDSESDEDAHDSGQRLRFKTIGPLQFYDAWGVKIFEKEIRSGKL